MAKKKAKKKRVKRQPKANAAPWWWKYIRSRARQVMKWSPEKRRVIEEARGFCPSCKKYMDSLDADHIEPVQPVNEPFTGDWNKFFDRLFNGKLQALCRNCHLLKCEIENKLRAQYRAEAKKFASKNGLHFEGAIKMGYLHIDNLYKDSRILQFDECWALEKIHGTSAHIKYTKKDGLSFYSGGETHSKFVELFDTEELKLKMASFDQDEIIVYGEAYGGKQQGMKDTYGPELKFVAFDVKMAGNWLDVPNADTLVTRFLKLEFVDYKRINADLSSIDGERDRCSTQAIRNGVGDGKEREGVVLRPIGEVYDNRGNRIITKHKNASFMETKTPRVVNPDKMIVLAQAQLIADEWVTEERLKHVLDRAQALKNEAGDTSDMTIEDTGQIVGLMIEDVTREAKGEIVESRSALKMVGARTAKLYHRYLKEKFNASLSDSSHNAQPQNAEVQSS